MAFLNPVHGLIVPFLCVFTIPLAIFASITSALAFSVLMFRVAVVYLDIAVTLIPQYFSSSWSPKYGHHMHPEGGKFYVPTPEERRESLRRVSEAGCSVFGGSTSMRAAAAGITMPTAGTSSGTQSPVIPFTPAMPHSVGSSFHLMGTNIRTRSGSGYTSPLVRKGSYGFGSALGGKMSRRSSSQVSLPGSLAGGIRPIHEDEEDLDAVGASAVGAGLTPSVGLGRDFEGVGGWRLDGEDDDEAESWTRINSRLELPLERASFSRYSRSHSAGPSGRGEGPFSASRSRGNSMLMAPLAFPGAGGGGEYSMSAASGGNMSLGSASKGSSTPSGSRHRMNSLVNMPSPFTSMDEQHGYFPDMSSTEKGVA